MILAISPKDIYATRRLVQEAAVLHVPLEIFSVQDLAKINFQVDVSKYNSLFIRQAFPWFEEVINLAKKFSENGKKVIDGPEILSGFKTSKQLMYNALTTAGLPVPKNVEVGGGDLKYPFILKWDYGFGGRHTYLIPNPEEFKKVYNLYPKQELITQEYIPADYEFEVFTVGYLALPKVLKFKIQANGFKADLKNYEIKNSSDLKSVVTLAELAAKATGRELAKVDILEKNGDLFVLEVNRSPSLIPFEQFTGYNVASEYVQYINNN